PAGTTGAQSQSFVVGKATAPVTVTVYEDFQCPACRDFESLSGATLAGFVADGTVKVEYRPVAILDRFSSTEYSSRALNAAGCVIAAAPQQFTRFHSLLFANQPAESSAGLDDARLTALGQQVGARIGTCVTDQTYSGWAARVTDQASKDGLAGTPTVQVDGVPVASPTPEALTAAIRAAAA
ncbi:MAG TPA: thioredoxin domain-containing protein, partial [Actinomycetales bacterium]